MPNRNKLEVRISINKEIRKNAKTALSEVLDARITDKMFDEFLRAKEQENWAEKFQIWVHETGALVKATGISKAALKEEIKEELREELRKEVMSELSASEDCPEEDRSFEDEMAKDAAQDSEAEKEAEQTIE